MVSAATEIIVFVAKMIFRFGFVMASVVGLVAMIGIAISFILVGLNYSVLADLFALVQMWLPFNLAVILGWLTVASVAYIAYRLSVVALAFIDKLIPR